MIRRDGAIGVLLLALSGWLYGGLGEISANPLVPIGPSFYPRILLVLIILLSLALIAQDFISRRGKNEGGGSSRTWVNRYQPTITCFIVFTLYIFFLPIVGFLISTVVFVTALQWLLGPLRLRRLPGSVLVGAAASLITYVVFEIYLRILLPRGLLFP